MIETARLVLRAFRGEDRDAAFIVNGDARVYEWLGGPIDRVSSDAMIDRVNAHIEQHGFGFWAAEYKPEGRVIGMIGLWHMRPELPPAPAIEVGWRLAPDYWGRGLAVEGARATLAWAFEHLATDRVTAITAAGNLRSQAVMKRCGMVEEAERAFAHPHLDPDHPLSRHLVYTAGRSA